ncbi:MAG TPA: hypothetical protein PKY96_17655 [Flavobacteriales bacterium]|nr:hypothetical protein [Flavobacteriales bacterium]
MATTINQYDCFLLAKDLNPAIVKGMEGVVLEVWDADNFLVEFVNPDGTNHEFNGEVTFDIDGSFIGEVTYRHRAS